MTNDVERAMKTRTGKRTAVRFVKRFTVSMAAVVTLLAGNLVQAGEASAGWNGQQITASATHGDGLWYVAITGTNEKGWNVTTPISRLKHDRNSRNTEYSFHGWWWVEWVQFNWYGRNRELLTTTYGFIPKNHEYNWFDCDRYNGCASAD